MKASVHVTETAVAVTVKLSDADVRHLHDFRRIFPRETAMLSAAETEVGGVEGAVVWLRVDPT